MDKPVETSNRTDGGFFVKGHAVMQSSTTEGDDRGCVVLVSPLLLARRPGLVHQIANLLNDQFGRPKIAAPKKARDQR